MTSIPRVAQAIQNAARCPRYCLEVTEQCEGLDDCPECLALAAKAALAVFEEPAT